MWRSEKNTFARTTPTHLDAQYSIERRASLPNAEPPLPNGAYSTNISNSGNRWFHVPGSGSRAALEQPDELVSCSLQEPSSSFNAAIYASALPGSQLTSLQTGWRDEESLDSRGLHELHMQEERRGLLSHDHTADPLSNGASSDISRLLRLYRDENNRLREQLKAKALFETHLAAKVEELSRQYAALQLEYKRAARDPGLLSMLAEVNEGSTNSTGGTTASGAQQQKVIAQLHQREDEVRQLQVTVRELEGRVEAYREALQRARAYQHNSSSSTTTMGETLTSHQQQLLQAENVVTVPSPNSADAYNRGAPASLHALLLESLNTADFLVKVFNALQHCKHARHRDDDGGNGGDYKEESKQNTGAVADSGNSSSCPCSRQACTLRCLQEAMRGAALPPDLRELADGPENNTMAANTEAALAVREELAYCETVAVRLAAALLGEQSRDAASAPGESNGDDNDDLNASVESNKRDRANIPSTPLSQAPTANAEKVEKQCPSETSAMAANETEHLFSTVAAKAPRVKASRCRPDTEDCAVQ